VKAPGPFRRSLRARLVGFAFATSSIAVVVACGAIVMLSAIGRWDDLERGIAARAATIAQVSDLALVFDLPDEAVAALETAAGDPSIVHAAVFDESGELFARLESDHSSALETLDFMRAKSAGGLLPPFVTVVEPIVSGGEEVGSVAIVASTETVRRAAVREARVALTIAVGVLLCAAFIAYGLQRSVSDPILALAGAARRVTAEDDPSIRVKRTTDDETGELVDAFNEMLETIEVRSTELRELADELEDRVRERTRELEAANRELESFSYSVSHDLRAPLRHVSGFIELLSRDVGTTFSETGRKHMDTIAQSASRMGVLIDELLAFSRSGRTELKRQPVDLDDLVREVVGEFEATDDGSKAEWQISALPTVVGDPTLLRQVLVNLIGNAVKFSRDSRPPRVWIEGKAVNDGLAQLSVRDNGVGFDDRYIDKLFGVFQRLHSNRDFEGTGIGLAIVQRIVTRHGGDVAARGRPSEGAEFSFTVPIHSPREGDE
jgi:signal transduction histidine kinase